MRMAAGAGTMIITHDEYQDMPLLKYTFWTHVFGTRAAVQERERLKQKRGQNRHG